MAIDNESKESLFSKLNDFEAQRTEFEKLINSINSVSPEMKRLWVEIYENAGEDRINAYRLFIDLSIEVMGKGQERHMNYGKILTQYLERMNKSNEHLLKLAEIIEKAVEKDENIDAADLYNQFGRDK